MLRLLPLPKVRQARKDGARHRVHSNVLVAVANAVTAWAAASSAISQNAWLRSNVVNTLEPCMRRRHCRTLGSWPPGPDRVTEFTAR